MEEQTEYMLGYALTFALILLGVLVVCIPRPRKSRFLTPEQEAKEKRRNKKRSAQAKKKRAADKAKKQKAKADKAAKAKKR